MMKNQIASFRKSTRKFAFASALLAAALLSVTALAGPYCITHNEWVGTGCWNQTCDSGGTFLEPAQGYFRLHYYNCCYTNGVHTSTNDLGCGDTIYSSHCCSIIADAPNCPTTGGECPGHL